MLPDHGVTARRRRTALAGHTGDTGTAEAGLSDDHATVRATALGALARLGRLSRAQLEAGLRDRDPRVRRRAAELAPGGGGAIVGRVIATLGDPDARVVEAACFALGEWAESGWGERTARGTAVVALCGIVVEHPDALCRETAVAALGAIGDPEGLGAILAATMDKPAVRRRAVLALAPFEGPDVDAALARALTDRDWQVRQAAEDLTGGIAPVT